MQQREMQAKGSGLHMGLRAGARGVLLGAGMRCKAPGLWRWHPWVAGLACRFGLVPEDVLNNIAYARAHNTEHQLEVGGVPGTSMYGMKPMHGVCAVMRQWPVPLACTLQVAALSSVLPPQGAI